MVCTKHPEKDVAGACVYCGKFFCSECLVEVSGKMYCKDDLSKVMAELKESSKKETPMVFMNAGGRGGGSSSSSAAAASAAGGMQDNYAYKSKMVTLVLCILLGWLGIHRYFVGKTGTGILYMCSLGLFGFGVLFDLIMILTNAFSDSRNQKLV